MILSLLSIFACEQPQSKQPNLSSGYFLRQYVHDSMEVKRNILQLLYLFVHETKKSGTYSHSNHDGSIMTMTLENRYDPGTQADASCVEINPLLVDRRFLPKFNKQSNQKKRLYNTYHGDRRRQHHNKNLLGSRN